ncbi:MAG: RimK/LysX family protein [Desulfobaccales bacterium]
MKYPHALVAGLLGALVLALPAAAVGKTVMGWIKKVRIYPDNFVVHAKLDSGAEYSSLDADHMQIFERDGKTWVRFDLEERARVRR